MEQYKQIYNTHYAISNQGNIKNLLNNELLKPFITKTKYCYISLGYNLHPKIKKNTPIHRLVYSIFNNVELTFYDKIYHKDGNTKNNNLDNLKLKKFKRRNEKIILDKKNLLLIID